MSRSIKPPNLFFFKTVLDNLGPFNFHMHFRIGLSISVKKTVPRVLIEIILNVQINLKSTIIAIKLTLSIYVHGRSFHLCHCSFQIRYKNERLHRKIHLTIFFMFTYVVAFISLCEFKLLMSFHFSLKDYHDYCISLEQGASNEFCF